ncbi:MAG: class I SAM-dependent methyltransferase [Promethearchaeota archaeon]
MEEWIKYKGESILREIGFKKGQEILDFGCGSGIYTLLASKIVEKEGKVYAIDSDKDILKELLDKMDNEKIQNIEVIETSGEMHIPLKNNSLDVILLYDVYHLLNNEERSEILKESARVLRKGGFISYLATHIGKAYDINLEKVNERMKRYGFKLGKKFCKRIVHWSSVEKCEIYNYFKN